MSNLPTYEIYAIRYATRHAMRCDNFLGGDPEDRPMPMDYFVWAAVSTDRTFVIDTGYSRAFAAKLGRELLCCPSEALARIGIDPGAVRDVILTHLHYDHAGNLAKFPSARFHLQKREMEFAVGPYLKYPRLAFAYDVEQVVETVRLNFAGRISFHDGDVDLAPGLSLHLAGGHAQGLQFVRVHTKRGWVVVASDVAHYYENVTAERPFPIAFHIGDMLEGFTKLKRLADSSDHIVPGHDPLVMARYPSVSKELEGIAVRLDKPPLPPSGVV